RGGEGVRTLALSLLHAPPLSPPRKRGRGPHRDHRSEVPPAGSRGGKGAASRRAHARLGLPNDVGTLRLAHPPGPPLAAERAHVFIATLRRGFRPISRGGAAAQF